MFRSEPDIVLQIKLRYQHVLQDDETDEDDELTVEEALRDMVDGANLNKDFGWKYAYALEALCWHFGELLDNSEWSPMRGQWSEQVDVAISRAGVPENTFSVEGHLMYRGSPIPIPEVPDFPFIGFLRKTELPEAAKSIAQCDRSKLGEDVERAIRQVEGWLDRARKLERDLFCFYY